jgi:hypothetical protein
MLLPDIYELILQKLSYNTHKEYIKILPSVCKEFNIYIKNIIYKKFKYENIMLQKIKTKLNDYYEVDFNVKSVEEFKKKNDYEIITAATKCNVFNDFNEIFYCDCEYCFNTIPCGRGATFEYDYDEYKFLYLNFPHFNWWINYYTEDDYSDPIETFDYYLKNEGIL